MAILTKEAFLNLKDCEPKTFESKVWGGELRYRPATVADKNAAMQAATFQGAGGKSELDIARLTTELVARCLIEPNLDPADAQSLMGRNAQEMERLYLSITGAGDKNPR